MVDEAVVRTDLNNVLDANGLNANDGILGPHREKEGSYYALREIFSPDTAKVAGQLPAYFNGEIEVENRYHFLNTNQCTFYWALVNFSKPFDRFDGYVVKQKGTITAPDIAASKKRYLKVAFLLITKTMMPWSLLQRIIMEKKCTNGRRR